MEILDMIVRVMMLGTTIYSVKGIIDGIKEIINEEW